MYIYIYIYVAMCVWDSEREQCVCVQGMTSASTYYVCTCICICMSINIFMFFFIYLCARMCPSILMFVRPSIRLSRCLFASLLVGQSTRPFIGPTNASCRIICHWHIEAYSGWTCVFSRVFRIRRQQMRTQSGVSLVGKGLKRTVSLRL